ncbi:protein FAM32A-like [Microcebus murinus]|uniref:protein FAM32A-like n=1 Tax=Microcebus murinus TaxID=30608 RepID=UPI003F6B4F80
MACLWASSLAAYEQVQKGALKPRGVAELGVPKRKKKKKDKDKAKLLGATWTSKENEEEEKQRGLGKRSPAQVAFEKMQEKRQMQRILEKASKPHRQRVQDFSRHLDALTEHRDAPKVSRTE